MHLWAQLQSLEIFPMEKTKVHFVGSLCLNQAILPRHSAMCGP
jgi:hypothetical protein